VRQLTGNPGRRLAGGTASVLRVQARVQLQVQAPRW